MVQLSHPYMTTGKTVVWLIQTFVNKVMSLLFNMLCKFNIDLFFYSRGKFSVNALYTLLLFSRSVLSDFL